jgi:hypothetical protein
MDSDPVPDSYYLSKIKRNFRKKFNILLTSTIPMILIVREVIIFMQAKHITGDLEEFFEGVKTFLTP